MRPTDPPTAGSMPCYELNIEDDHNDMRWNEGRHVNMKNKWQQNSRFEYRRRREDEGKEKYVNRNKGMGMEANVINTNNEKDNGGNHKGKKDHEKVCKRFTLLNSLINDEELIPNIDQRKIVDEFLSKKNDNNSMGMNGWTEEMKRIPNGVQKRKSSFRFSNFITDKKEFLPTYGEVNERAEKLREKVKECQKEVDMFPHDERIKDKSRIILKECHKAIQDEYSLLCQKAKVEWLNEGLSKCGTAVHPEYHSIGHGKLPKVVYYIWQERNNRLFRNEKRDINTIINIAKEAVGMKLLGIKVKESGTVKEVEEKWM
ncbi:hypothetical protein Tco_1403509 [Tanacetum coccineum]